MAMDNEANFDDRLGILAMILCLATGISTIFSFNVLLIIIAVIAM